MNDRTRIRTGGAVTMVLGAIGVAASWSYWAPCIGEDQPLLPDGLIDNERLTEACVAAGQSPSAASLVYLVWPAAFIVVMIAAAYARRPWVSILALIPLIILFPVTDPGFFWQSWDTADIVPGSGVLSSAAIVVSGIMLWFSASTVQVPAPESERTRAVEAAVSPTQ